VSYSVYISRWTDGSYIVYVKRWTDVSYIRKILTNKRAVSGKATG